MSGIKEDIKKQQRQHFGARAPTIHARLAEDMGEVEAKRKRKTMTKSTAADSMETSSTKQGGAPVAKVSKKLKSKGSITEIRLVGVLESFFETRSAFAGQNLRAYERMTVEEKELMSERMRQQTRFTGDMWTSLVQRPADNAKYLKYFTEPSRKKPAIPPYIEVGVDSLSRGAFEFASTPIRSI
ncbi:hypothetical protein KI688_010804 [Linnemannia hyalina]|uniref:Uncharacterized protein n=1 Tax=Linnemannia hyalina TaxID=64524 RepID=A0A9P8BTS0_9FUNG|nr:hypothetical protein KI688_010804 [Linnemannia hyalina]